MRKIPSHWVTCYECGKRFNTSTNTAFYDSSIHRYVCAKCKRIIDKRQKAANRAIKQQKEEIKKKQIADGTYQPNWWERNWKWFIGGLCVFTGIAGISSGWIAVLMILAGVGFILAYFLPIIKGKRDEKAKQIIEQNAIESEQWQCPACGAQTKGQICEYCGSKKPD